MTLNEASGRSSILERTELTSGQIKARYTVDVITFDDLIDEFNPEGPFGLKIDTEGFEIEVLKGIKKHSKEIKFIICEASIKNRFVNGYRFSELIATLAANGFELFSVLNIPKRVSRFYDCLFLQRDHPLFDGKRENAQD